ncbi:MAG: putative ATPase [Rhodospirillales bacterium]|nr:putative ATPase [Rhodospirillales bacterium]
MPVPTASRTADGAHASLADGGAPAFLFTDIEGSTRRWETMPDQMAAALRKHDEILRHEFGRHGGRVFKLRGDGLGVVFPAMRESVSAAIDAQRALIAQDWSAVGGIKVRIAMHTGPVEPRDGDFFGPTLNHLARLLDVGHGGQILISAEGLKALAGQIQPELDILDLGRHQLRDLIEPSRIYQISTSDLPKEFAPLRSLNPARHNLPSQVTPLVGREGELEEIRPLLERDRLITLIGPGGIGKTRLAVQLGAELLDRFADGVWLVEFAAISDPALLPNVLAKTFGIQVEGNSPALQAVILALQRRKLLLILDNCEHLTEAVAELGETLLLRCSDIRILATSREKLGLIGESLFRVGGLLVPPVGEETADDIADRWPAMRLFSDRALAADKDFVLDPEASERVAEICRRLDGIPLALELAAARLSALSVSDLAESLSDWFKSSAREKRGVASRHKTLHATMDWSYNLLSLPEQAAFRQASVFAGSWTLNAAAEVLAEPDQTSWDIRELLGQLVDKSLMLSERSGKTRRFRLLETARAYGLAQLKQTGELDLLRSRHAAYYQRQMESAETTWGNMPTAPWLATIEPEIENIRAALEVSLNGGAPVEIGQQLAAASPLLWTEASLQPEGRKWLALAGESGAAPSTNHISARLLLGRARLAPYRDDGIKLALAQEAVALFRTTDDRVGLGDSLSLVGAVLVSQERFDEAEQCHREAYALLSEARAEKLLGRCANSLGHLKLFMGNIAEAKSLYEEARARADRFGDAVGRMVALCNLAEADFALGNYAEALTQCRSYIEICRAERRVHRLANGLANLAAYLLAMDDPIEARAAAREALIRAQETQSRFLVVISIEHLAVAGAILGEGETAARLLGFGDAHYEREGIAREPTERIGYEKARGLLLDRLGANRIQGAFAQGKSLTEENAIEEAFKV